VISVYQGDKEAAELADRIIAAVRISDLQLAEEWLIALNTVASHTVERLDTHREATIQFKFTVIDVKE